eukprot:1367741-Amorphochlora_amoeboformis.AAC.1
MDIDMARISESIRKIVREGNLDTLTNKIVRKKLEAIFGVSMKSRKKEIKIHLYQELEKMVENGVGNDATAQPGSSVMIPNTTLSQSTRETQTHNTCLPMRIGCFILSPWKSHLCDSFSGDTMASTQEEKGEEKVEEKDEQVEQAERKKRRKKKRRLRKYDSDLKMRRVSSQLEEDSILGSQSQSPSQSQPSRLVSPPTFHDHLRKSFSILRRRKRRRGRNEDEDNPEGFGSALAALKWGHI